MRRTAVIVALALGAGLAVSVSAQQEPETPAPDTAQETTPDDAIDPEDTDDLKERPCLATELEQDELIDRVNRSVYQTVCGTARWFDGFFGDDRAADEAGSTFGYVNLGLLWTEVDGLSPRGRGRVRVDFPNLEGRANAFIGRVDPEAFLSDTEEQGEAGRTLRGEESAEWLLGFGFTPLDRGSRRLSTSVGVRATWPPDPYVKVQYRWYHLFTSAWLFRWRHTVFWEGEEGAGTTLGLDLERRFSERTMLRLTASHTWSESTLGVAWWNEASVFRQLGERLAVAVRGWSSGETDAPVEVREYGIRFLFRRKLSREWLFGEIGTGVYWPRDVPELPRESSLGLWLAVELQFGNVGWDPDET